MRFAKKLLLCAGGATLVSLVTACGSGSGTVLPSNVRLVNLLPATSTNATTDQMTLTLNSNAYTITTDPTTASGYASVTPSTYTAEVQTVNDTTINPAYYLGLPLGTNQYFTVFAYEREGALYPYALYDDVATPASGIAQLTIANASPDVGAVDVYVTQHTSSSPADPCTASLSSPAFTSVQGQQTSPLPFTVLDSNGNQITYDVCVTSAGTPTDPRLSYTGLTMASTINYVLALTTSSGGSLLDGAIIPQTNPATITLVPNTKFRVRAISASSDLTDEAVVTVGSTALPGIIPGTYTPYEPVPVGSGSMTISVTQGSNSASTSFTPSEGADYTVLLYNNSSGTLTAAVLTDDNRYVTGKAKVRLINGADTQVLSMFINGAANNETLDIAEGAASGYASVTAGADTVKLQSSDLSATASTAFSTPFDGGGVYTVLLYNLNDAAIAITDR